MGDQRAEAFPAHLRPILAEVLVQPGDRLVEPGRAQRRRIVRAGGDQLGGAASPVEGQPAGRDLGAAALGLDEGRIGPGRQVAAGDRFPIDKVVLEVTSHRTPCNVFALRMGDPKFVRRFHQAGRPGAYCRVIAEGAVHAGQPVRHARFAGERTTVAELMALDGVRDPDPAILRRALTAPVHYKMRVDFEEKLARLF